MSRSRQVDYDAIAHRFDGQPYRLKTADPEFAAFLATRKSPEAPAVLDIACGTGSQLIANRPLAPDAHPVGIDFSLGMLMQARRKAPGIGWVCADAAALPLSANGHDYIGCQFGFHHFDGRAAMLADMFRVLRPGGRFVMRNMCPERCPDWLYYEYFPQAGMPTPPISGRLKTSLRQCGRRVSSR